MRIGNFGDRLVRRLLQLYVGLALYGLSMALMVESTLGLDPWDVFHQGLALRTCMTIGTASAVVGELPQRHARVNEATDGLRELRL